MPDPTEELPSAVMRSATDAAGTTCTWTPLQLPYRQDIMLRAVYQYVQSRS